MNDIVYLRDLDGTGSMHPCAHSDNGAIAYYQQDEITRLRADLVRQIDINTSLASECESLREANKELATVLQQIDKFHQRYCDRVGASDDWARFLQSLVKHTLAKHKGELK